METRRAEGTQYSNGRIGLDTGLTFESIGEMTDTLRSHGAMKISYQDEGSPEDPTLDDVSNEPPRIPERARRLRLIKNAQ